MIREELICPKNIVVVGGSNHESKPGGRLLENLIQSKFPGEIYVVNRKETNVKNCPTYNSVDELPVKVDLAILAIPAQYCVDVVKSLTHQGTKAFIIISAGFGELNEEGKQREKEIVNLINNVDGTLIGPNCIGVLNRNYSGVFTLPIPELSADGCDLISSSGATAVFIMEAAIPIGLKFNQVFSVGNAAQTSVEDVLEYLDNSYVENESSKIKLLYIEHIKNPQKFYKHCVSLIKKGCRIAAIKSGTSESGARAAFSHTGALAGSEVLDRALLRKSGVVYCSGRMELIAVAGIFSYLKDKPENLAIITHAGGSAVLLTDVLEKGGLKVPDLSQNPDSKILSSYLYEGSSVSNPIDFLATGTADQLGIIIDFCEHKFDEVDGIIVVFGSPGLFNVKNVYNVLDAKMRVSKKPIFPVLPSIINARDEINYFLSKGHVNFTDEVELGRALCAIHKTPNVLENKNNHFDNPTVSTKNLVEIKKILSFQNKPILNPKVNDNILKLLGIETVNEKIVNNETSLLDAINELGFPLVMKVIGPVHKTEVNGVSLNISNKKSAVSEFERLMKIESSTGVLIQEMVIGSELYVGAKREDNYGSIIMCGLGGIYLEVLKDTAAELAPVSFMLAKKMIQSLKCYPLFKGVRNQPALNEDKFADIISRISLLMDKFPEVQEIDLNPVIATANQFRCVDARILIKTKKQQLQEI